MNRGTEMKYWIAVALMTTVSTLAFAQAPTTVVIGGGDTDSFRRPRRLIGRSPASGI